MRIISIVFFVLLAAQITLRLLRPDPTPDWYRVLVIATAVGIILCLVVPPVVDRLRRPRRAAGAEPGATPREG